MNQLTIKGTRKFSGKEIPIVAGGFGKDKKSMSDKTIAAIHNMNVFDVRRRITDNIKRFKENVDFIDLKKRMHETQTLELLLEIGYAKQSITQAEHIYILSERGYAKLIKIMDTDIAWEIHDKLIDEYFQFREVVKTGIGVNEAKELELKAKSMRAEAMRLNAQTRAFKEMKETIPKDKLSNVAFVVFGIKGLEKITGTNLGDFLPEVEKTYSASEVGNRLGISSKKVGSIANANGLKTDEYGITVMDKSPYSSKEVQAFRYNEKGVAKIKELLG
jgi:hypothetical protein